MSETPYVKRRPSDPELKLEPEVQEEVQSDPTGKVKHWLKLAAQMIKNDEDPSKRD